MVFWILRFPDGWDVGMQKSEFCLGLCRELRAERVFVGVARYLGFMAVVGGKFVMMQGFRVAGCGGSR